MVISGCSNPQMHSRCIPDAGLGVVVLLTGSEVPLLSFAARSLPCIQVSCGSPAGTRWAHLEDIRPQHQAGLCRRLV
jgi:hypothetical protein